jgi:hypothetical protein
MVSPLLTAFIINNLVDFVKEKGWNLMGMAL